MQISLICYSNFTEVSLNIFCADDFGKNASVCIHISNAFMS